MYIGDTKYPKEPAAVTIPIAIVLVFKGKCLATMETGILIAVAPRPIAFASTIDNDGNLNLSPFSFFNAFSANPPILIFSPARRVRGNTIKHTLKTIPTQYEAFMDHFTMMLGEITEDELRNRQIIEEILKQSDRKILVLSERIEHLNILCVMDTGDGAAFVYRDNKKAFMIPMPFIGHTLKKLWGMYAKARKLGKFPRIPGM